MLRDGVLVCHPQQRSRVRDDGMMNDAVFFGNFDAPEPCGNPFDTSFCQNPFLSIPAGYRSIVMGRPRK